MKVMAVLSLVLLAACASKPRHHEVVFVSPRHERWVVMELAALCTQFYPKETMFHLETTGRISQQFEREMRKKGYAFSNSNNNNEGKAATIMVDQLDQLDKLGKGTKATLYLKIIIDNTEFTRTINTQQARYLSSGAWTRVVR